MTTPSVSSFRDSALPPAGFAAAIAGTSRSGKRADAIQADDDGSAGAKRTLSVILADDDPLIVATLGRGLRDAGLDVVTATTAAGALEALDRSVPDLAVLDFKMPDSTGVDLARAISARANVPIVFLSGYSDASIVREAIDTGAMTYLVKPIDIAQLLPVIRSAVERSLDLQRVRAEAQAALVRNRTISIATGLLMSHFKISQKEAYERLRRQARSARGKLEDAAEALLRATEEAAAVYEKLAESSAESTAGRSSRPGQR